MEAIITDRLELRGWQDTDATVLSTILGDPEVFRYLPFNEPRAQVQCLDSIHRMRDHWVQHGYGVWALVECLTGSLIGYGGLRRLDDGRTELLYGLARAAWGKGYATEFGTVALEFAFGTGRLGRVVGFADPDNHASRHVLEKLGFAFEGEGLEFGMKVVCYGLENKQHRF